MFIRSLRTTSRVVFATDDPLILEICVSLSFVRRPSFVFFADSIGPMVFSMNLQRINGDRNTSSFGLM